jgi:hypothetical protein
MKLPGAHAEIRDLLLKKRPVSFPISNSSVLLFPNSSRRRIEKAEVGVKPPGAHAELRTFYEVSLGLFPHILVGLFKALSAHVVCLFRAFHDALLFRALLACLRAATTSRSVSQLTTALLKVLQGSFGIPKHGPPAGPV